VPERDIERMEATPGIVAYFTHVRPRITNHAEQGCEAARDRRCPTELCAVMRLVMWIFVLTLIDVLDEDSASSRFPMDAELARKAKLAPRHSILRGASRQSRRLPLTSPATPALIASAPSTEQAAQALGA
jgi:hypothetical protein